MLTTPGLARRAMSLKVSRPKAPAAAPREGAWARTGSAARAKGEPGTGTWLPTTAPNNMAAIATVKNAAIVWLRVVIEALQSFLRRVYAWREACSRPLSRRLRLKQFVCPTRAPWSLSSA